MQLFRADFRAVRPGTQRGRTPWASGDDLLWRPSSGMRWSQKRKRGDPMAFMHVHVFTFLKRRLKEGLKFRATPNWRVAVKAAVSVVSCSDYMAPDVAGDEVCEVCCDAWLSW